VWCGIVPSEFPVTSACATPTAMSPHVSLRRTVTHTAPPALLVGIMEVVWRPKLFFSCPSPLLSCTIVLLVPFFHTYTHSHLRTLRRHTLTHPPRHIPILYMQTSPTAAHSILLDDVSLVPGRLLYFKPNKSNIYSLHPGGKNPPQGQIDLSHDFIDGENTNFMCEWPRDAPSSCRLALPVEDRTYYLYYDSAAEADRWIRVFTSFLKLPNAESSTELPDV